MKDEETIVKLLNIISKNSEYSQRDISTKTGISLGKVNYVLKALINKGLVKTENFINSRNKRAYRYLLTSKGIRAKLKLTRDFVQRKIREYETLLD